MFKTSKGFTLIELLIVIAIIVILAAVLIPNLLGARNRAQITSLVAELRSIATGMETYSLDKGNYPDETDFPDFIENYLGGKEPVLPWDRDSEILIDANYDDFENGTAFNLTIPVPTGLQTALVLMSGVTNATQVVLTHDRGITYIP